MAAPRVGEVGLPMGMCTGLERASHSPGVLSSTSLQSHCWSGGYSVALNTLMLNSTYTYDLLVAEVNGRSLLYLSGN